MKIDQLAEAVLEGLKKSGKTLATAESCTGGWIGQALTEISGSSAVYCGGVISYTNAVKETVLGVPAEILDRFGAVSEETACAMASGVRKKLRTDLGVSVTGIAGPNGDGSGKPVGLVYIGIASAEGAGAAAYHFVGDRTAVRQQAVEAALQALLQEME